MKSNDLDSIPEGYIDELSDIGFEEFLKLSRSGQLGKNDKTFEPTRNDKRIHRENIQNIIKVANQSLFYKFVTEEGLDFVPCKLEYDPLKRKVRIRYNDAFLKKKLASDITFSHWLLKVKNYKPDSPKMQQFAKWSGVRIRHSTKGYTVTPERAGSEIKQKPHWIKRLKTEFLASDYYKKNFHKMESLYSNNSKKSKNIMHVRPTNPLGYNYQDIEKEEFRVRKIKRQMPVLETGIMGKYVNRKFIQRFKARLSAAEKKLEEKKNTLSHDKKIQKAFYAPMTVEKMAKYMDNEDNFLLNSSNMRTYFKGSNISMPLYNRIMMEVTTQLYNSLQDISDTYEGNYDDKMQQHQDKGILFEPRFPNVRRIASWFATKGMANAEKKGDVKNHKYTLEKFEKLKTPKARINFIDRASFLIANSIYMKNMSAAGFAKMTPYMRQGKSLSRGKRVPISHARKSKKYNTTGGFGDNDYVYQRKGRRGRNRVETTTHLRNQIRKDLANLNRQRKRRGRTTR
jgi:hypothetical protein